MSVDQQAILSISLSLPFSYFLNEVAAKKTPKIKKLVAEFCSLMMSLCVCWEARGCCLGSPDSGGLLGVPGCKPQPGEGPRHGGTGTTLAHGPEAPRTRRVCREVF